jgi:hypothetical protein
MKGTRRQVAVALAGLAAEVVVAGFWHVTDPRTWAGVGGAVGLGIAVVCSLVAGPVVGGIVGFVGSVLFVALVANEQPPAPKLGGAPVVIVWTVAAAAAGLAARRLRERTQQAVQEADSLREAAEDVAETLQRSMLPARIEAFPPFAVDARYLPANGGIVGGDWYDVIPLPPDRIAIVVGDVAGSGVYAAAMMGRLRTALRAYLIAGHSPAGSLELLCRYHERTQPGVFATVACVVVDVQGSLRAASGGHLPPLLADATSARIIDVPAGPPLGAPGPVSYEELCCDLDPPARIVLVTDGLVERRDVQIDDGLTRLLGVLRDAEAPGPACDALVAAASDPDAPDDRALVVLDLSALPVTPAGAGRTEAQRPSARPV